MSGADPMPLRHAHENSVKGEAVLEVCGVSKRFGAVRALKDVSMDIRSGEVLGLVGENGAGKSTLLRTLAGAHQPDAGELRRDGTPLRMRSPRDAHQQGIRVISQEPELVEDLSVAENIFLGELPRRGRVVDRRGLKLAARELIRRHGFDKQLDPHLDAKALGRAQRQLVEILKALKSEAQVIAFDEPTSSLTHDEAQRLFAVVRRLRDDGVAVVYVSHRLREILELADRVAVLRDGELVAARPAASLQEDELVRLMVGRKLAVELSRRHSAPGPEASPVLEARGLRTAWLKDVDLTIRAGEVVGVAGLIGAGRSELAKALFGEVPLASGALRMHGRPVRLRSPRDAIAAGIGYAPEDRKGAGLVMQRSVAENISLASLPRLRRMRVVRRGAERKLVEGLMGQLRIKAASPAVEVGTLSGGNQQKVVLARQLARHPDLLILDEPTQGVDVGAKAEIYALIDRMTAEGLAVLLISSELPEVLSQSHRILVMENGRIRGEFLATEATEEAVLTLAIPQNDGADGRPPTTAMTDGGRT